MRNVVTDKSGKELSNFVPRVIELIDMYLDTGGETVPYVKFCLEFDNGHTSKTNIVSLGEIEKIDWLKMDIHCWFEPNTSPMRISRHLCNRMREELSNVPRKTVYRLTNVGMSVIAGQHVFCTGQEVIRPSAASHDVLIDMQPMKYHLEIDAELTEDNAISKMIDLISLSPNPGRIILAYKLGYLMRQAYADAGKVPKGCIYLYGRTGTQKTTLSSFLNQMYNRSKGIVSPPRLDASIAAAVKILQEFPNDVVIFDDLCPVDSNSIRGQQEATFIEIIRYIGDGTVPIRMRGKNLSMESPRCGVIFTGEYGIGKGSDAARFLSVEMTQPDKYKLEKFQRHPLDVSTFYYFYITWFIKHYDEIVMILKEWWHNYCQVDLGVHDRLREMQFFLDTSYSMFLEYCVDKQTMSKEDAINLHRSFYELLSILVQQQQKRVEEKIIGEVKPKNYLEEIRKLYRNNEISIAHSVKGFSKQHHDGVIHRERLYLRREKLSVLFPLANIEEIADALEKQGVLETGKKSRTMQLSALNGMRFYVIPLRYLNQSGL